MPLHKSLRSNRAQNDRGAALIVVIFAMMLFSGLTWSMMTTQSEQILSNLHLYESEQALYNAETGVQWGSQVVLLDKAFRTDAAHGYPAGYALHRIKGGEYKVICRDPQAGELGTVVVEATGFAPSESRALGVRSIKTFVDMTSVFSFGLFASEGISLSSQAKTDSYTSEDGLYNLGGNIGQEGDVGTNGDISMSGQAYIGGDALIGPTGTFNDTSRLSGSIITHPPIEFSIADIPQNLVNMPSAGTISDTTTLFSGDYKYDSIDLTGPRNLTLVGPINLYLVGSLSLRTTGQAKIIVSIASTGPVRIYAEGDVSLSGQGVINQTNLPENFIIFGTNPTYQDIRIVGQGAYFGAIYAPTATLSISGNGDFFGSYCGKVVDAGGQAFIHYDEALNKISAASLTIDIPYWQEQ